MPDYAPPSANGASPFTLTAASAVVGGTFVEASATTGQVQTAGLNSTKVLGIAAHDAGTGQRVSIWPLYGAVHEITHTAGGTVGACIAALANWPGRVRHSRHRERGRL